MCLSYWEILGLSARTFCTPISPRRLKLRTSPPSFLEIREATSDQLGGYIGQAGTNGSTLGGFVVQVRGGTSRSRLHTSSDLAAQCNAVRLGFGTAQL